VAFRLWPEARRFWSRSQEPSPARWTRSCSAYVALMSCPRRIERLHGSPPATDLGRMHSRSTAELKRLPGHGNRLR
jgi:hypothetical protein